MLRITINGAQVAMNVKRRIPIDRWDLKSAMPKVTNAFTDDLYIVSLQRIWTSCTQILVIH